MDLIKLLKELLGWNVTAKDVADDALGLFKKAVKGLKESNDIALGVINQNIVIISDAERENQVMTALSDKNNKVINNLKEILGE